MSSYIKKVTGLLIAVSIIVANSCNCMAANSYHKLKYGNINADSHNRIFEYDIDSEEVSIEKGYVRYKLRKCYTSKKYKNKKLYASVVSKGIIEEPYIWSDTECNGTFYTYAYSQDNNEKSYLVYDDAKGNNIFKLKFSKLNSVFINNNCRAGKVVNVGRFKNKVIIIMQATVIATDFHNIQHAYACIVYDINKHKIVSSNILDKFSASVYGVSLTNPQIDGKYVYFVERSGSCEKISDNKIDDRRKRAVVVYNYSGKKINSIDYTKYIKRLTNYVNKNDSEDLEFLMGEVDCNMAVNNGKIYIATGYGIYKVTALTTSFSKVCDVIGTGLTINAAIPVDFKYVSEKKFAYAYTVDDCRENILLNEVVKK